MSKAKKEYSEFTERYIAFTRKRISDLLAEYDISEHKLSIITGHSDGYINSITSGRSLPSFDEFLYICEMLKVTPCEFFNENNQHPVLIDELITAAKKLKSDQIKILIDMANSLGNK